MDCVARILEFYDKKEKEGILQSDLNKLWLSNLLIKIMSNLNGNANSLEFRNCLILLVNLFGNDGGADHYNNKGKDIQELSHDEKHNFKEIMLRELMNN